jgi:hypothetical protein
MADAVNDWRNDARFVGAFIRGGSWEVGLRIARRVQPGIGQGTTSSKSGQSNRISLRDFAAAAFVSTTTISTYLKAWELAADDGRVEHAADLVPDDEYFWDAEGLHENDWKRYYRKVSEPAPKPAPKPAPAPSVDDLPENPETVEPEHNGERPGANNYSRAIQKLSFELGEGVATTMTDDELAETLGAAEFLFLMLRGAQRLRDGSVPSPQAAALDNVKAQVPARRPSHKLAEYRDWWAAEIADSGRSN